MFYCVAGASVVTDASLHSDALAIHANLTQRGEYSPLTQSNHETPNTKVNVVELTRPARVQGKDIQRLIAAILAAHPLGDDAFVED